MKLALFILAVAFFAVFFSKPLAEAPRFWHKLYANMHGYYWLQCQLCGRNFGGHEKNGSLWGSGGGGFNVGKSVCSLHPGHYVMRNGVVHRTTMFNLMVPYILEDIANEKEKHDGVN